MKTYSLVCFFSFSLVAMDNTNDAKNHFAYENDQTYITYESTKDKNICVLNISLLEWEKKPNMTFVHKNGIPINEIYALAMLDTDAKSLQIQMKEASLRFLQGFSDWGTLSSSDSQSFTFHDIKFKKPQVRIMNKNDINQENNGIFGRYVDTNFLIVKVNSAHSLIYSVDPEKKREICLYFYILNQVNGLEVFPYKAKLVGSYFRLCAEKEVRYF